MTSITNTGSSDDRFWENALSVSAKRLELIASNIANADTPHYKARDIDFQAALSQAMSAEPLSPAKGNRNFLSQDVLPVLYRVPAQASADSNTVDMDIERAAFADSAIRYQHAVQTVAHEYKEMSELFKSLPY